MGKHRSAIPKGASIMRFILLLAWVVCCGLAVGGTSAAQTPLSKKAEHLLGIVETPKGDYQERRTAARDLGKLKDKAAVGRLLKLLPGDFDALSGDVILALGDIGDPRALPKLDEIYAKADLGSKLSTALYHTREILRKKEKESKLPLPGGNVPLPELVKECKGALVATLEEVGGAELGPPGATDYAAKWKVEQVLRGDYAKATDLSFRVQSLPEKSREKAPAIGKRYILITHKGNAGQIAAILEADEKNLRQVQDLLTR
jgi:hypothetical protein